MQEEEGGKRKHNTGKKYRKEKINIVREGRGISVGISMQLEQRAGRTCACGVGTAVEWEVSPVLLGSLDKRVHAVSRS